MAVADKLAQMAQYANEVQDLMDKEVELPDFSTKEGQLQAATKTGSAVFAHPKHVAAFGAGGWWFSQLTREEGRALAIPIAKFTPDLYFEAKPIERLWVEKTFEREQKKFSTEVAGDVIEWTPLTREVLIQPSGRVELGEFASYFNGKAYANFGKAKGESAPLLGVAPTTSSNAYKIEADQLVVPRLDKILKISEAKSFPAEWNEERKMLLVYLEGVTMTTKV